MKVNYPYIRAWGKLTGSFSYYIEIQVARAAEENAPQDVIYRQHNGKWVRLHEIQNEDAKERVLQIVEEMLAR